MLPHIMFAFCSYTFNTVYFDIYRLAPFYALYSYIYRMKIFKVLT